MSNLLAQGQQLQLGDEPITGAGFIGDQVAGNLGDREGLVTLFSEQLSNIIAFITVLGGIFFVVYLLIAGFDWLRAGGDKGAVEKAQQKMINAAIGLLVMILAVAIIGIVGGVFGLNILDPGETFLQIIPSSSSYPGGP
ncbi:hypothetical protein LRY65_00835 [Candidatus Woesebacteria bacterium]|nr:hypothetical protein [Candidatus Woesebacteria bacterium]MCD8507673.1 hypothetical protein [Candidatus Woesebacteria bacterium]MCD8526743.1 hypothetical protein [Candidatus Woesebacteria bacterium]MCD8546513.1 hypothetical protein [Candidatus Woesebacteria bacterium]